MKGFRASAIAAGMVAMQTAAVGAFTVDLRTASVVCAKTNSVGCVTAVRELEKHLDLC